MLSILNLKGEAYLIAIKNHLSTVTGKKMSLTAIHLPLSRLEKRKLIQSEFGDATPVRGGRRKKIYNITKYGFEELKNYKKVNDILWENFGDLAAQ